MLGMLIANLLSAFVWYDAQILGLPLLVWCALAACAYYIYAFFFRKRLLAGLKTNLFLTFFVVQGLVWLALSFAGLAEWFRLPRTFGVDLSYAPRQAFYLVFLPLAVVPSLLGDGARLYAFLRRYGVPLAAAYLIFASHTMPTSLALAVSPQSLYLLCGLCLFGSRRDPLGWILLAILWLLPSSGTGDSTVLLLRILCTGFFLLGDLSWVQKLSVAILPCILIVSILLPLNERLMTYIDRESGLDPTVGFRASIWCDEDLAAAASYGMGVGFGTTYASNELVADYWPELSADKEYTAEERPFVTAPHSTFVSVAFRQGVLGLLLLCGFFLSLWRRILHRAEAAERRPLLFLLWGGALMISLNVGFESPQYFQVFLLALAYLFLRLYGAPRESCPRQKPIAPESV